MTDYEPTGFYREITARLRGFIARFEINQADLAILCDVSQSQFSKIIRGTRPMTVDQLAVICDALSVNMEQLVGEVERFINDRDQLPSPVHFVIDEQREENPTRYKDADLDGWGRAAGARWDAAHVGTKDDYELSARTRETEPTDEQ